jgi:hypothetical protein
MNAPQAAESDRQLTVREYAKEEGITIQTVYRRLWEGRIKARQVMGRWLIAPNEEERATA